MTRSSWLLPSFGLNRLLRAQKVGMATKLEAFLDRIAVASSRRDLQTLAESLRDIYDVEHAVYHAVNGFGDQFAALTYDGRWEPRYRDRGYVQSDPVVRGALTQFHPLDWKRLDWSGKAARQIFREAVDVGIGNQGLSIPIRGPNGQFALFTVNQRSSDVTWGRFLQSYQRDFLLISHHFHQTAATILRDAEPVEVKELSPRERDALTLLGLGLGRGQVAERLAISEHTLRVYIDTARHKLGALNTTHAVALAHKNGQILI